MEEKVYEVEMIYIQNTFGTNYTVETSGRRAKTVKLNFSGIEAVEIDAARPLEVKNSYLQLAEGQNKMWNMRFAYPTNLTIKAAMNKIVIDVA